MTFAAFAVLAFLAVIVALLATVLVRDEADDTPYDDDVSMAEWSQARRALERARTGGTPDNYRDGVRW